MCIRDRDCLSPYDGSVQITSPTFTPGIEYEVNMRNEEFEEFAKNVRIDEAQTFKIDSLLPGEYTFFKITPRDSKCSFAMKDTTINIVGPNELLQADVTTNTPICEGASLALSANVFPEEGTIEWTGPNGFKSTDLNVVIDSSVFEQSGLYEMVFTYGVCEQIRELDILIHPDICLLYTSPSPRDRTRSRMPSSA